MGRMVLRGDWASTIANKFQVIAGLHKAIKMKLIDRDTLVRSFGIVKDSQTGNFKDSSYSTKDGPVTHSSTSAPKPKRKQATGDTPTSPPKPKRKRTNKKKPKSKETISDTSDIDDDKVETKKPTLGAPLVQKCEEMLPENRKPVINVVLGQHLDKKLPISATEKILDLVFGFGTIEHLSALRDIGIEIKDRTGKGSLVEGDTATPSTALTTTQNSALEITTNSVHVRAAIKASREYKRYQKTDKLNAIRKRLTLLRFLDAKRKIEEEEEERRRLGQSSAGGRTQSYALDILEKALFDGNFDLLSDVEKVKQRDSVSRMISLASKYDCFRQAFGKGIVFLLPLESLNGSNVDNMYVHLLPFNCVEILIGLGFFEWKSLIS